MADIAADPHYRARGAIVDVGGVPMQGLLARLSRDARRHPLAGTRARAPTTPEWERDG